MFIYFFILFCFWWEKWDGPIPFDKATQQFEGLMSSPSQINESWRGVPSWSPKLMTCHFQWTIEWNRIEERRVLWDKHVFRDWEKTMGCFSGASSPISSQIQSPHDRINKERSLEAFTFCLATSTVRNSPFRTIMAAAQRTSVHHLWPIESNRIQLRHSDDRSI